MPARRYIVTGSDTDAGKTYLTCALLRALTKAGRRCRAVKPVVTGFHPDAAGESDGALLLHAMGRPVTLARLALVSPLRYAAPQSPDIAALAEGAPPPAAEQFAAALPAETPSDNILLIEGVGGLMVPLNERETTADAFRLIQQSSPGGAPLIFAAPCRLGGLSACLTGLAAARAAGLKIEAVAITHPPARAGETPPEAFRRSLLPHLKGTPLYDTREDLSALAASL